VEEGKRGGEERRGCLFLKSERGTERVKIERETQTC
jgi:hypothetical protein